MGSQKEIKRTVRIEKTGSFLLFVTKMVDFNIIVSGGGKMRRPKCPNKGALALTFAFGLLISCFCPPKFLVAVLAVWVIILGISSCR